MPMTKEFKKRQDQDEQTEGASPVSFDSWFTVQLKVNKKLQAHHHPVIKAYFAKNNLTELEAESTFDSMLKKFGF